MKLARPSTLSWRRSAALTAVLIFCAAYCWPIKIMPNNRDPHYYLKAADDIRHGRELTNPTLGDEHTDRDYVYTLLGDPGDLYATWPPGLPIAIAIAGGGLNGTRIVNTLGLFATLILGYALLRQHGAPVSIGVACGMAFISFITDMNITFTTVAAETLFIPLWMAWIYSLPYLERDRWLWPSAALIGMAALTRYIAIPFVAVGALVVLVRRGWWRAVGYGIIAGAAIGVWLLRNYLALGSLTGHRLKGDYAISKSVPFLLNTLTSWGVLVAGYGAFCLLIEILYRRRQRRARG